MVSIFLEEQHAVGLNGIEYNDDEIVSGDIRANYNTCVFDVKAGLMLDETFVKLIAWYDNEWGYSNQCISLVQYIARQDEKAVHAAAPSEPDVTIE
ncbi:hypothetical protein [Faecalicatena contorta]|uniref:hypothetical protein n=1 Tax=Faecalicatena contorta TaxID=39482 RepID=UPI001F3B3EB4|nr:hypothetical protein [Faecalicatena contorta]